MHIFVDLQDHIAGLFELQVSRYSQRLTIAIQKSLLFPALPKRQRAPLASGGQA
jgi:hypothetical protein